MPTTLPAALRTVKGNIEDLANSPLRRSISARMSSGFGMAVYQRFDNSPSRTACNQRIVMRCIERLECGVRAAQGDRRDPAHDLTTGAGHEHQTLEQLHVLLVLEQRAGERRHHGLVVLGLEHFGGDIFGQQEFEPVEQLGSRGLFLQARQVAHLEKHFQCFLEELFFEAGKVHVDDLLHRVLVRELDVMEKAAAQERVGQFLFVVRGDHHQRPDLRLDVLAGLVDVELHAVELAQQVVGEFDVGLVDLVDQQYHLLFRGERLPEHALDDVVLDALDLGVAELRIAQARHRVVFIQALLGLGGRLDVPLQERHVERGGDFLGEHGLAGARLALDQERALQGDRGIDREAEVVGGDVVFRAFEAHGRGQISGNIRGFIIGDGHGHTPAATQNHAYMQGYAL